MDFSPSPKAEEYRTRLVDFMESHVKAAEPTYREQVEAGGPNAHHPQIIEDLKVTARELGLWNLFLPFDTEYGAGLSNVEYAPLAEITGWNPFLAPEAINCAAPDTGNAEIIHMFGTPQQKERFLEPLMRGETRSAFSMTEPDVASSDATNISTSIRRDGDEYVVSGRKWWSSGGMYPRCAFAIVMGITNPDADPYHRQSMILVPLDTQGVTIERGTTVFGYAERGGHAEILYDDVRVPAGNLLGNEGGGFAIAQARLGPGRIHHCMRSIGMAERALALMCERSFVRHPFGMPLAEQGVIRDWVAEARIMIDQARLLVLKTAWLIDTQGNKAARNEVSAIKVVAPRAAVWVIDRAIQVFGGAGVSQDTPLAELYAHARILQIADGPDEVHKRSVARRELRKHAPTTG